MKTVITSMLVLFMTAIQAMPVDKDSADKGKKAEVSNPTTTPVSSSLVSMQQLQQENAALKVQIFNMENKFENENSMLQYNLTMLNVMSKLNENGKLEMMEELQSQLGFTKTMANTLMLVKSVR